MVVHLNKYFVWAVLSAIIYHVRREFRVVPVEERVSAWMVNSWAQAAAGTATVSVVSHLKNAKKIES
jgi:hypothetical protein